LATSATTGQTSSDNVDSELVNIFYARLRSIYDTEYDRVFFDADSVNQSKAEWSRSISVYSEQEIMDGLNTLRDKMTQPNSPYTFLHVHKIIGLFREARHHDLPTQEEAYIAACNKDWIHPVVYHTAQAVGVYELLTRLEKHTRPMFNKHYPRICEMYYIGDLNHRKERDLKLPQKPPSKSQIINNKKQGDATFKTLLAGL